MNTISSYLATVLNTSSPPPTSSLRRSIPIPSTPSSNPPIPTSTTLKSRHIRLNSSPLSSSSSERTFDRSSSSVSASIRDLRSRCSSTGTETAGDDWTLGDLLLSQVEMEGADVAFRLGWLEDEDDSIDGDDSSVDGDEDESALEHSICVMAILPSIENEDGCRPSSRKRSLEDAAEGSRKCPRLADITQPQRAGDAAAAEQPLEDAAEGSRKRRRSGGSGAYWDPVREAAVAEQPLQDAAQGSRKCLRLASVTEMPRAGDVGEEATVLGRGWRAINHPPARFSGRYIGSEGSGGACIGS
ncbi:hypothetical protein LTR15_005343 [Elasticomyces elasticus]|nr:hypothetical protein LTR15_005343 [Elasticomyces elasticus]